MLDYLNVVVNIIFLLLQLKGSELEITLVRGGLCERVGPACAYVNLKVCVNGTEQGRNVLGLICQWGC